MVGAIKSRFFWQLAPRLRPLFDTYKSELFAQFQDLGLDLTKGHALAEALGYHTSNRPLFGFAKRHRESNPKMQTELNIALGHHVSEENEKGVQLSLWAGADPHAPALSLRFWRGSAHEDEDGTEGEFGLSAVYEACARGNVEILQRLRPDPQRDDFDQLYQAASRRAIGCRRRDKPEARQATSSASHRAAVPPVSTTTTAAHRR